jgi:hypothetical protein
MSAPATVSIILENLAPGALDVAPGDGRRPAIETDTEGVRAFLEAFAALPAVATEEADARIRLATPAHRLVVRHAGGRLIVEEADSFVATTVDEIVVRLFAPVAGKDLMADEAAPEPSPSGLPRRRRKVWVLTGLLVVLPLVWWSTMNPETPDGVDWVQNAGERQAIFANANGQYASDDERLNVDGATAGLVVAAKTGEETLRTTLRVGRRAGVTVLVTKAGVLIEITADDRLSIGDAVYHRVPPVR